MFDSIFVVSRSLFYWVISYNLTSRLHNQFTAFGVKLDVRPYVYLICMVIWHERGTARFVWFIYFNQILDHSGIYTQLPKPLF